MSDDRTSQKYLEQLEKAAKGGHTDIVFTIPHGFQKREQDEQSIQQQRIRRQFEKLVRGAELVTSD